MITNLKLSLNKNKIFFQDQVDKWQEIIMHWVSTHYLQLAVFNALMLLLVLLRSAGYFEPIFLISINFIVFLGLILSVIFLGAKSSIIFATAVFFIILAIPFEVFGSLQVWAERTIIYAFEAIILGLAMLIIETLYRRK